LDLERDATKTMKKSLLIMKILAGFLCCFVPTKKGRKKVRRRLVDDRRRRGELLDRGFKIEAGIITTPEGVRIDVSDTSDNPMYLVKEVFVKGEYKVIIGKDSILIDIGMNRAAVSLLFASCENIKKIYAYEPFKPTFELAKRNLELNPQLSRKIQAFNVGLGKADTTLELPYMSNATGGMSTTYDVCRNEQQAKKETVVIRDAAKEITPILRENSGKYIIVKCDCEGAEFEIFERLNQENMIGKIDVIAMEYHFEKPDSLIKLFTENGFVVQSKVGSSKSKTGYIYAVKMAARNCG
jgi:FkbM family methyltransferase